ncbi:MAG: ABC transporter substrate-binding protein [Thermomicrobiales bacterium]
MAAMEPTSNGESFETSRLNRRALVRHAAALGLSVPAASALLAARDTTAAGGAGASGRLGRFQDGAQEITIAQGLDPESLDPHATTVSASENVGAPIVERFVNYDYARQANAPVLATEWTNVDDLTWEVKLREGVTFTNGEPMNAEAVKFSLERIMTMTHATGRRLAGEELAVEVVDELTIRLTTKNPFPFMIFELGRVSIVPPAYVQEVGDQEYGLKPVGTGPFMLEEWVRGDRAVLVRNDNYWGEKPALTRVTFRAIPEPSSRTAALQTGEVDLITLVSISDIPTIEEDENLALVGETSNRSMFVRFDTADPRMADTKVRQAFNYAVDKHLIIDELLAGHGTVLDGQPVGSHILGHNPNVAAYEYDPDQAKALLDEAGFDYDTPLVLFTPSGRYAADKETAEAIAGMLAEIDVQLDVQPLEWGVWIGMYNDNTLTPMTFIGIHTFYPDANSLLNLHVTGSIGGTYNNPAYDEIVNEAARTVDEQARLDLYHQAIQIIHDDPAALYLHQQEDLYAHNARVQGFTPRPDEMIDLTMIATA